MKTIFHCGYPKCGSTSLQKHLFSSDPALAFISPDTALGTPFVNSASPKRLEKALMDGSPGAENEVPRIWRNEIAPGLDAEKVNVFSQESLVFGGERPGAVFGRIARHITPHAEILFVLRPQEDIIRSYYDMEKGYSEALRWMGFKEYLECLLSSRAGFMNGLMFSRMVGEAIEQLGQDRVHVLTFQSLFSGGPDVDRLARVLGVDRNRVAEALTRPPAISYRMSAGQRITRRIMGPVRGSWFLPVDTLRAINRQIGKFAARGPTPLSPEERKRIVDLYAADNARLAELVPEIGPLS